MSLYYKRKLKVFISGLILCAFLAIQVSPGKLYASPAPVFPSRSSVPSLEHNLNALNLSEELGRIKELYQAPGNRPAVILIQDAHAIPEAQKNIRKIIRLFEANYGVRSVALEGAASKLDAQFFKSFPEKKNLKQVFEAYAREAEVTGGTLAAVLNAGASDYFGVENWELYQEGINDYLQAMKSEKELLNKLEAEETRLLDEMKKKYPEKLWAVVQTLRAFERNEKPFVAVLETLSEIKPPPPDSPLTAILTEQKRDEKDGSILQKEVLHDFVILKQTLGGRLNSKDLSWLNSKKQLLESGEISAVPFFNGLKAKALRYGVRFKVSQQLRMAASTSDQITNTEGEQWLEAFEAYTNALKSELIVTDAQRRLENRARMLYLDRKLAALELTRKEWEEYKNNQDGNREKTASGNRGVFSGNDMRYHLAFYGNAEKRDRVFLEKMERFWSAHASQKTTLLVAGGFHTQGMMRRLREKGISYAVVIPAIKEIPKTNNYRKQMSGEVSWKHYFKEQDGKVSLYEAFVRGARDRLLINSGAQSSASKAQTIKRWRDKIILDLADQRRLAEAGRYTRFLDEVTQGQESEHVSPAFHEAQARLKVFTEGLLKLDRLRQFTQPAILHLLQEVRSTTPALVNSTSILTPGYSAAAPLVHGESVSRSEMRSENASAGEPSEFFERESYDRAIKIWKAIEASPLVSQDQKGLLRRSLEDVNAQNFHGTGRSFLKILREVALQGFLKSAGYKSYLRENGVPEGWRPEMPLPGKKRSTGEVQKMAAAWKASENIRSLSIAAMSFSVTLQEGYFENAGDYPSMLITSVSGIPHLMDKTHWVQKQKAQIVIALHHLGWYELAEEVSRQLMNETLQLLESVDFAVNYSLLQLSAVFPMPEDLKNSVYQRLSSEIQKVDNLLLWQEVASGKIDFEADLSHLKNMRTPLKRQQISLLILKGGEISLSTALAEIDSLIIQDPDSPENLLLGFYAARALIRLKKAPRGSLSSALGTFLGQSTGQGFSDLKKKAEAYYSALSKAIAERENNPRDAQTAWGSFFRGSLALAEDNWNEAEKNFRAASSFRTNGELLTAIAFERAIALLHRGQKKEALALVNQYYLFTEAYDQHDFRDSHLSNVLQYMDPSIANEFLDLTKELVTTPELWPRDPKDPSLRGAIRLLIRSGRISSEDALMVISDWVDLKIKDPALLLDEAPQALHLFSGIYSFLPQQSREQILIWTASLDENHPEVSRLFYEALHKESVKALEEKAVLKVAMTLVSTELSKDSGTFGPYQGKVTEEIKNYFKEVLIAEHFDVNKVFQKIRDIELLLENEMGFSYGLSNISLYCMAIQAAMDLYQFMNLNEAVQNAVSRNGGEFFRESLEAFRLSFAQALRDEFVSGNKIYTAVRERSLPLWVLIFDAIKVEALSALEVPKLLYAALGEYIADYPKALEQQKQNTPDKPFMIDRPEAPKNFMRYIDYLISEGEYGKASAVMDLYRPELQRMVDYLVQIDPEDPSREPLLYMMLTSLGKVHYKSLFYLLESGGTIEAPLWRLLTLCADIPLPVETEAQKKASATRAAQIASIALLANEKNFFIREAQTVLEIGENFDLLPIGSELAERFEILLLLSLEYRKRGMLEKSIQAEEAAGRVLVAWEKKISSPGDLIWATALGARFLEASGHLERAIQLLETKKEETSSDYPKTLGFYNFQLAVLYQKAGRIPQAVEALSEYFQADAKLPVEEREDDNAFLSETMFWPSERKEGMAEVYAALLEHPSNAEGALTESLLRALYFLDMKSGAAAVARYVEKILDSPESLPVSGEMFLKLIAWLLGARYSNWKLSALLAKAAKRRELKGLQAKLKPYRDVADQGISAGDWLEDLTIKFESFLDDEVIRDAEKLRQSKKFSKDPAMKTILELSQKSQKRKELTKRIREEYNAGNFSRAVELYEEGFGDIPKPSELLEVRRKAGALKEIEGLFRAGLWHDALLALKGIPETDRDKTYQKAVQQFGDFEETLKAVDSPLDEGRFRQADRTLQKISRDYQSQWGTPPQADQGNYPVLQRRISDMAAGAQKAAEVLAQAQNYGEIKKAAEALVNRYPEEKERAFEILTERGTDTFNRASDIHNDKKRQAAYLHAFQLGRLIYELAAEIADPPANSLSRAKELMAQAMGHYWLPQLTDDFWIAHGMAEAEREKEEHHESKGTVSFQFSRGKVEFQGAIKIKGLMHLNGDKGKQPVLVNTKEAVEIGDTFRAAPAAVSGEPDKKPLRYLFKVIGFNEQEGTVIFEIPKSLEKPQVIIQEILTALQGGGTLTRVPNNTWFNQRETVRGIIRNMKSTLVTRIHGSDKEETRLTVSTGNILLDRMMGLQINETSPDEGFSGKAQERSDEIRPLIEEYAAQEKAAQQALGNNFEFDPEQKEALIAILNPYEPIVMVQGPPGTGKTTVLKAAIRLLIKMRQGVLITSQQNHAIDKVLLKTIEGAGPQEAWLKKLVRIASKADGITHEDILRIYEERIQRLSEMDKGDQNAPVSPAVYGTTVGLTQDRELRKQQKVIRKLKTGIMDESSRATRLETFHLLSYFDGLKRIISVGDPFQLPAYGISKEDVTFAAQWLGKGPLQDEEMGNRNFGEVFARPRRKNFKISLFEKSLNLFLDEKQGITRNVFRVTTPPFFYFDNNRRFSGWLLVKHSNYFYKKRKPLRTLKEDPGYFQLDDTAGLAPEGGANGRYSSGPAPSNESTVTSNRDDETYERYNLGEVDRTIYWINHFINERQKSPEKIAVITPYRRQISEIKKSVMDIAWIHHYLVSREEGKPLPSGQFLTELVERYFRTRVYLQNIRRFRAERFSKAKQGEVIDAAVRQLWVEYRDLLKDKSEAGVLKAKAFREKLGLGKKFVLLEPGGNLQGIAFQVMGSSNKKRSSVSGKKNSGSSEIEDELSGLKIETIDSSIGDEWDAVIVSWVRSNAEHDLGFLAGEEGEKRRNVADSRGAEMVQIMDVETFTGHRDEHGWPTEISEWGQHKAGIWEEAKTLIGDDSSGLYGDLNPRRGELRSEQRTLAGDIAEWILLGSEKQDEQGLSRRIVTVRTKDFTVSDLIRLIEEAGLQLLAEKDQALVRTALYWMNEVLNQEGATAVAFDVPESEKSALEALLSHIKGKGRGQVVALLAQSLGDIPSEGIITQRVRDFDHYRPLYSIRGVQIQNADRVARIRLGSKTDAASSGAEPKENPNLFYVSAEGNSNGADGVLNRLLELAGDLIVGAVTSREINSTRELQTSPADVEQRVLRALLKGPYEDLIPQGKGMLHIHSDGTISVDMPIFSSLLQEIRSRFELEQAA